VRGDRTWWRASPWIPGIGILIVIAITQGWRSALLFGAIYLAIVIPGVALARRWRQRRGSSPG